MKNLKFRFYNKEKKEFSNPDNLYLGYNGEIIEIGEFNLPTGTYPSVHNVTSQYIVSQSTGLFDMNHKEIFEGDIVQGIVNQDNSKLCQGMIFKELQNKKVKGVIMYSQFYGAFYFTDDDVTILFLNYGINDLEVIGNIYENEELITNN
jgi:uncharacterized phage protein (TIGR01671 family)